MIWQKARTGLIAARCALILGALILGALTLSACSDSSAPTAPAEATGDEARALADAAAMLDERAPEAAPRP